MHVQLQDAEIDRKLTRVLCVQLPTGLDDVVEVLIGGHFSCAVQRLESDGPPAPAVLQLLDDMEGFWVRKWGVHRPQALVFWVTPGADSLTTLPSSPWWECGCTCRISCCPCHSSRMWGSTTCASWISPSRFWPSRPCAGGSTRSGCTPGRTWDSRAGPATDRFRPPCAGVSPIADPSGPAPLLSSSGGSQSRRRLLQFKNGGTSADPRRRVPVPKGAPAHPSRDSGGRHAGSGSIGPAAAVGARGSRPCPRACRADHRPQVRGLAGALASSQCAGGTAGRGPVSRRRGLRRLQCPRLRSRLDQRHDARARSRNRHARSLLGPAHAVPAVRHPRWRRQGIRARPARHRPPRRGVPARRAGSPTRR